MDSPKVTFTPFRPRRFQPFPLWKLPCKPLLEFDDLVPDFLALMELDSVALDFETSEVIMIKMRHLLHQVGSSIACRDFAFITFDGKHFCLPLAKDGSILTAKEFKAQS